MGKVRSFLVGFLFLLTLLYPIGALISYWFHYRFILVGVSQHAISVVVLSIMTILLDTRIKHIKEHKSISILRYLTAPLSIINGLLYILACPKLSVVVCVFICIGCCSFLAATSRNYSGLKAVALGISLAMILPMGFMAFIACIFGNLGKDTVVQTVISPNQKYCAQVIDSDQGATGGATIVRVCQKSTLDAILFRIEKKPKVVYYGRWGVSKTIKIHWKDNRYLIINSREYEVK